MFNFSAINLGCNKNLVDLEFAIGEILKTPSQEINFFEDPLSDEVEYVLINTCSFLSSSRAEAEETISYYDSLGKKVIIMGCYTSLKDDDYIKTLKNLHSIVDYEELKNIGNIAKNLVNKDKIERLKASLAKMKGKELDEYLAKIGGNQIQKKAFVWAENTVRAYLNAPYSYEFLKISEGCDNNCSFCIIPKIRGRQNSRTIENIVTEVKTMIASGIKEIQIISQDTTRYGTDLYGDSKLYDLLEEIDKIPGDFKFRLFYMYPDSMTLSHLERLKNLKKMLPYFDIPFQHISPEILKKMGRFYDEEHIYKLLDYIKSNFPGVFIHTNFIVGFPGETEEDYKKLCDFAKKYEFDSVSMFGYHDEEMAASSKLGDKVPDREIEKRVRKLGKILNSIYDKKEASRIGKEETGYIMDILEDDKIIVRPEIKAPEIDDYDEINFSQVIDGDIDIGEKIIYKR
ncbi:MAG: MiaB/RimO family radical SAM methylthiotransferase [Candidatus Gracilibacteria bacterium]|nr:MiaB/RimO family radical SAM methylthiotransferase [Candidatus Gracilibacteria bacterium]